MDLRGFKCKLIISTVILLTNGCLFSQSNQDFNKVFEKETADRIEAVKSGKFKNVQILSYYPDTLPKWFFNLPANNGLVYAIGISDPDMELEKAKELALLRAKTNALLFSNSKVQYFRDIYTSAAEAGRYTNLRQRFDTYFKLSASALINNEMFAVVDTHFTRYNEYIVLLTYNPSNASNTDSINLTAISTSFFVEASVDGAFEEQAEYEMMSIERPTGNTQQKAHYLYREKGERFLSYSLYAQAENDYPVYVYSYASPYWNSPRRAFTSYNGLWSIFSRQFLNYLTLNSQNSSIKLKNLGEQYTSESTSLTREIASFTARLNINGINFDSDTFKLDIQVEELVRLIK